MTACYAAVDDSRGSYSNDPSAVPGDVQFMEVSVVARSGHSVTCYFNQMNEVWCFWGESTDPVKVPGAYRQVVVANNLVISPDGTVIAIDNRACALTLAGALVCWEYDVPTSYSSSSNIFGAYKGKLSLLTSNDPSVSVGPTLALSN